MRTVVYISLFALIFTQCQKPDPIGTRWSEAKAWEWQKEQGWMAGTNFNPSTAINQLEFFQEATFDRETIDRELAWSAELGMKIHRVYLHNLLWDQDSLGFLSRVDEFLTLANKHNIKTMLVLLDDVWHPIPKLGTQPDPIPFVHNSGWVQAPGAAILGDSLRHHELKNYVKGVMGRFANDTRVVAWDLYNEPDNVANQPGRAEIEIKDKYTFAFSLLKKVMRWAREVNPSQPLTVGLWQGNHKLWGTPGALRPLERFMVENSDVISFHAYDEPEIVREKIVELKKYNRPLLCTEYMARTNGSTFEKILPILKENQIHAINWGFVSGKTNTIFPWSSWNTPFDSIPKIWFHDVYRTDKTPFSEQEIEFLKQELLP
ncbi:MAG: cellulase family glycosylhydrolase [Bacteroidetes bacterium]|nr:cellulase family glycosylhydrolase [Bacteroidota bacterium]MDA0985159.1 cellulase family glycosylhydrolase [Bacteroidota bacterium]